ncbi:MAG: histidine kinase [Bacteroidales bacterium]|nr:histidine kinase [Bacteroidales bacterium]
MLRRDIKRYLQHIFRKQNLIIGLTHPLFLALFPAIAFILLSTNPVEEHYLKITNTDPQGNERCRVYYEDLNNDGISEKISLVENNIGCLAIKLQNSNDVSLSQHNFPEFPFSEYQQLAFIDHDKDGYKEIYFITFNTDSIFLNCLEPFDEQFKLKRKYIDTIFRKLDKPDVSQGAFYLTDVDEDNTDEVVFLIKAGFALYPRRIYAYDYETDAIDKSPLMGATLAGGFEPINLDGDIYDEFIFGTKAYNNFTEDYPIPYPDSSAWFMALDHDLEFLFPPVEVKGLRSIAMPFPMFNRKNDQLIGFKRQVHQDEYDYHLALLSLDGRIVKSLPLPLNEMFKTNIKYIPEQEKLFVSSKENRLIVNRDLEIKPLDISSLGSSLLMDYHDLDGDGTGEYIFENREYSELLVVSNDFSKFCSVSIPRLNTRTSFGPVYKSDSQGYHIQVGSFNYVLRYRKNPYSWLQIPYYLLIYAVSLLFVWVIMRIQKNQLKQRYVLERKVEQLKLRSVRNQLDPHFMFNTINTIASSIFRDDKHIAYRQLIRFSQMMRSTVEHYDKTTRRLGDELDFIRNYLEIQKQRFGDKINYDIDIDSRVDINSPVPTMAIQTYVENAIKHGLKPLKDQKGEIKIAVKERVNDLKITVQDNGVGRIKSKEYNKETTKMGLKSLRDMYQVLNAINDNKIKERFTDLYDKNGNAIGTKVELVVPKGMEYRVE